MKYRLSVFLIFININIVFSQDVNLLNNYNGDFEIGMSSWRFFEVPNNLGSYYEFTSDAVSGSQAIKINYSLPDNTLQDRGLDNWLAGVPVISGSTCTLKAYVKSAQTTGLKIQFLIGFFKNDGSVISPQHAVFYDLTDTYTEHQLTAEVPNDAVNCWVAFRMYNSVNKPSSGIVYIDNVRLLGEAIQLEPRVMQTSLHTDDVPIAGINVLEAPYFAKNDGSADATKAFQKAIDYTAGAGGGVVFAPAGKYRFDGNLIIPNNVILRGEWKEPSEQATVEGTVLMPYANKGNISGTPFVSIMYGAGLTNLSIWYPEQKINSVQPYPWTIQCHPEFGVGYGYGITSSVINVTLVNAYQGIKIGPMTNSLHFIKNVYGTPLNQGIWLSQTVDIGRLVNVNFKPKYWSNSGLTDAPSEEEVVQYLRNNSTIGITMGRSDWEYIFDVKLEGYDTGVKIIKYSDHGPNGVIYGLQVEKSKIGIDLVDVNSIGWAVTGSTIEVDGENSACIKAGDNYTSIVQFNKCVFGGNPQFIAEYTANSIGRLSFQNCEFQTWGRGVEDPAIVCSKGSLSLMGCKFDLDRMHVALGEDAIGAQIVNNFYLDDLNINNQSNGEVIISNEPLGFKSLDIYPYIYAKEPRPLTNNLYNVIDFGAVNDGNTDNTSVFQNALDKAAEEGGGTVYVPAGKYRIDNHIKVPTGVELRGIWDIPHHTVSHGSILYAYEGKNEASGVPFISLESGAGIRGLTIWYPEQNTSEFVPYPWTIQSLGENCWIKDVTLGNPYQGVDFGSYPSAGHIINYLAGAPIKTGVRVDNNSGDGWIENVHFNPTFWSTANSYETSAIATVQDIVVKTQDVLDAFQIGSSVNENIMGTFVYGPNKGMQLMQDDGNSKINIYQHGSDAASNGVYLESQSGTKINFINTQLVLLGNKQNGIITTSSEFNAEVNFYNVLSWGGGGATLNRDGEGTLLIQQHNTTNGLFDIKRGINRLENVTIGSMMIPQYRIGENVEQLNIFGGFSKNGFTATNNNTDRSRIEMDYNYKQIVESTSFKTGWEEDDLQLSWDNVLWGNHELNFGENFDYRCKASISGDAYKGQFVLEIEGENRESEKILYKALDLNDKILEGDNLSYRIRANNEGGKLGYIDLQFMDGTKFSELLPVVNQEFSMVVAGLGVGEWKEKILPIGQYAEGKSIQTLLVGSEAVPGTPYDFYIDELNKGQNILTGVSINKNNEYLFEVFPNPVESEIFIDFNVDDGDQIKVVLMDLYGRPILTLINRKYNGMGEQKIMHSLTDIPVGLYILKFQKKDVSGRISILSKRITKV